MTDDRLPVAGWREWVGLPDVHVPWLKAKLDTGARSSSLHAFDLEPFRRDDRPWVRFSLHPWQRSERDAVSAESPVHDQRTIRSSTGHEEERFVIVTTVELLGAKVPAEVTLTNRDSMGFRMLIGREALRGQFLVDPGSSYAGGRPPRAVLRQNRNRQLRTRT